MPKFITIFIINVKLILFKKIISGGKRDLDYFIVLIVVITVVVLGTDLDDSVGSL